MGPILISRGKRSLLIINKLSKRLNGRTNVIIPRSAVESKTAGGPACGSQTAIKVGGVQDGDLVGSHEYVNVYHV